MPPQNTDPVPQPQPSAEPTPPAPTVPPTPPAQPTQPPVLPTAPVESSYKLEAYYMPEGHFSIFGYRKSVVTVQPGMLVVHRKSDNSEIGRVPLTPDLKMKYFLNFVRIAQTNGQKFGLFSMKYGFILSMASYGLFIVGLLINAIVQTSYDATVLGSGGAVNAGPNLGVRGFAIAVMVAALVWMAADIPKAKAFIAACKKAAGIA